ncbi:MAG: hypothetical protein AAF192_23725 [Pseudomonadota bacterium]
MAGPFGQAPTWREFIETARSRGFQVQEGIIGVMGMVRITAPNGGYLIQVGLPDDERVSPRLMSNFKRRLGEDFGFPCAPDPYDDEDGDGGEA